MAEEFDEILKRAQSLSREEQIRLLEALTQTSGGVNGDQSRSVTDLKGLGKEVWQGIAPDNHV